MITKILGWFKKRPRTYDSPVILGMAPFFNKMTQDLVKGLNEETINLPKDEVKEMTEIAIASISSIIRQQGPNASPESFESAQLLGLNAKKLLAQHKDFIARQADESENANQSIAPNEDPRSLISLAYPEKSIDLCRKPPSNRALISANRFPQLDQVRLLAIRDDGANIVEAIFQKDATPPSLHVGEAVEILTLDYPSEINSRLRWNYQILDYRSAETVFVQQQLLKSAGMPASWSEDYSAEAVFMDMAAPKPIQDMRGTLFSGPTGPAPMPIGKAWPVCPCCAKPASFAQSLDMRDVELSKLLPGTTMVIFVCSACLFIGKWRESSTVIWLELNDEIALTDRGNPSPIYQASQWYGPDSMDIGELPEGLQAQILEINETRGAIIVGLSDFPWPSPGYNTKAGGFPNFIGNFESLQDRSGFEMEFVGQISTPDYLEFEGYGYIFHSTLTGETIVQFQF